MKKTLLLSIAILICCGLKSKAQWVETSTLKNVNWEYCFKAPVPPASNTRSQDNLNIISTSQVSDFLPFPTSGEVQIMTNTEVGTGRSSYTLNGTCDAANSLTMVSTSGATGTSLAASKFLASKFYDASKVMSMHFNITLNNTPENITSTWYVFIGAVTGNTIFTSNSSTSGTGSGASPDARAFASIRIQKTAKDGKYELAVRKSLVQTGNVSYRFNRPDHFTADVFETGVNAKVDIYCNNETSARSYSHNGGAAVSLPGRKMDIYVNNVKIGTYDQSVYTANPNTTNPVVHSSMSGQPIDGIGIYSREAASSDVGNDNSASVTISNLKIVHLATPTPLPVALTDFNGKVTNNGVTLNWQTASEQNNSHFILKRSNNGSDFSVLARIDGNGTTNNITNYSYTDKTPSTGANYYLLEQIDLDGTKKVIDIIVSVNYTTSQDIFTAYRSASNTLKVKISSARREASEIIITDITGKIIYKGSKVLQEGINEFELPFSGNEQTLFVVSVKTASASKNAKFIL